MNKKVRAMTQMMFDSMHRGATLFRSMLFPAKSSPVSVASWSKSSLRKRNSRSWLSFGLVLTLILSSTLIIVTIPESAQARTKKKRSASSPVVHHPRKSSSQKGNGETSPPTPDPSATFVSGAPFPPRVIARSAIVIDARTGKTLYEKNADEHRAVASTTKLLTALLINASGDLDKLVKIETIDTLCEPTKANVKPGETYTRRYLLYALLVHSCNDIARALARDNAGSISNFVAKMNQVSAQIGATNSVWTTPNGLPTPGEVQYSTARDMARIALAAYSKPVLRDIVRTQRMTFQYNNGRTTEYNNTNQVLLRFPLCNGMKTGYTDAAGHCLVSSAASSHGEVISVLLGDNKSIWSDSQHMLEWALNVQQSGLNTNALAGGR